MEMEMEERRPHAIGVFLGERNLVEWKALMEQTNGWWVGVCV